MGQPRQSPEAPRGQPRQSPEAPRGQPRQSQVRSRFHDSMENIE